MEAIHYTVYRIDGDYAILVTENGEQNPVAMALLPHDISEGDHLICEFFTYRLAD